MSATGIGALASLPVEDRFSASAWLVAFREVGLEFHDDIGWLLPSLLATMLSFYIFMVGEELAKVDAQVRRRRRLTLGLVGVSIAGSGLAVSLLTIVSYIDNPASWPNAIPVVTMGTLVVGLGAAVGSFEIETFEVRRRAAEADVESAARASLRVNTPTIARRREWAVYLVWIFIFTLVGFAVLCMTLQPSAPWLISTAWISAMAAIPIFGTVGAAAAFRFLAAYRYSGSFGWLVFICLGVIAALAAFVAELLSGPALSIGRIMLVQLIAILLGTWFPFHRGYWPLAQWTINGAVASNISRSLAKRSATALSRLAAIQAEARQSRTESKVGSPSQLFGNSLRRGISRVAARFVQEE